MPRYVVAPLKTLQNILIELAAFRTGQSDLIPEQRVHLLREATRLTTMARTVLQVSPTARDRFERLVHAHSHDDYILRRAAWDVAERVGVDETLRTAEEFVSRLCDLLASSPSGGR